jgi:hypothetical protein
MSAHRSIAAQKQTSPAVAEGPRADIRSIAARLMNEKDT